MVKGREYTFHIELAMTNASGAGWNATIVDEFTVRVFLFISVILNRKWRICSFCVWFAIDKWRTCPFFLQRMHFVKK